MKRNHIFLIGFALAFALLAFVGSATLHAAPNGATITVTTTADEFGEVGQGCALREAIQAAELDAAFGGCGAGAGSDTIILGAATYSITRTTGDNSLGKHAFKVSSNITLLGVSPAATIINGNGNLTGFAAFSIGGTGTTATFENLTIRNGNGIFQPGGALFTDGQTKLTLRNVIVRDSVAAAGGGGIANSGTLVLVNSQVIDNRSGSGYGGGGIFNQPNATLTLTNSTVQNNVSEGGAGGIENAGNLTITHSTLDSNRAATDGGAIRNANTLVIRSSTLSNNSAGSDGGALRASGSFNIVNTTITQNHAAGNGGGIYTLATGNLYNVTLVRNIADYNYDGAGSGGGLATHFESVTAYNSIIAKNTNVILIGQVAPDDCAGDLNLRYSLLQTLTGCQLGGGGVGNHYGSDPQIGPLADNGGATQTIALLNNSAAIDQGAVGGCLDDKNKPLTTDQRGYIRPVDGDHNGSSRCDIGAFEFKSIPVNITPIPVTPVPTIAPPTPTHTPVPSGCNSKPAAPAPVSPAQSASLTQQKIALDWQDANCATKYKVQVRQDAKKGLKADKKSVTGSTYTTKKLAKGHTYYWRIRACNSYGCVSSPWTHI